MADKLSKNFRLDLEIFELKPSATLKQFTEPSIEKIGFEVTAECYFEGLFTFRAFPENTKKG